MKSECINGDEATATVTVNNLSGELGGLILGGINAFSGSVELDDNQDKLDESNLVGNFNLNLSSGIFSKSGTISTGNASGKAKLKGIGAGTISASGTSYSTDLVKKRRSCGCDE